MDTDDGRISPLKTKEIKTQLPAVLYDLHGARAAGRQFTIQIDNNLYASARRPSHLLVVVCVRAHQLRVVQYGTGNCTNFDEAIGVRILCMGNYGNTKPVTMSFRNQVKIMRWLFGNKTCIKMVIVTL